MRPDIFKPNINKQINNNSSTYYSFNDADRGYRNDNFTKKETPTETFKRLQNSGSYIFNKPVIINTREKTYNTKIAGKIGNRIVTMDGDSINLNDIVNIEDFL